MSSIIRPRAAEPPKPLAAGQTTTHKRGSQGLWSGPWLPMVEGHTVGRIFTCWPERRPASAGVASKPASHGQIRRFFNGMEGAGWPHSVAFFADLRGPQFVGGSRLLRLYEHHHLHRRRLILLAIIVDIGASAPLPAALCSPEVPEPRPSPELARSPR